MEDKEIKKILLLIIISVFPFLSKGQVKYLSEIITKNDIRKKTGEIVIGANYWRYDTCLLSKKMCKYNTYTGLSIKILNNEKRISYEILRGNNSGYLSKNPYDTFSYFFSAQSIYDSKLVRKILVNEEYVAVDTFFLTPIDSFLFTNYSLVKKIFGRSDATKQKSLKIYVLKSIDKFGSTMLHYWVERIGIVKLTDENCWRYSFELKDDRTKTISKMFIQIMKIIKAKYKDPYWLSRPCGIEDDKKTSVASLPQDDS